MSFYFNVSYILNVIVPQYTGADPGFQVRGGALKKIAPKNHIFPISGGGARNFWGISCEKSRFYAKKIIFFSNFRGGARRGRPPPPESAPGISTSLHKFSTLKLLFFSFSSCLTIERSIVFKTVDRQCESFSRMFIMRVWYFYNEGLVFL